ncbi:MAG: hypothetical protein EBS05_23515 [Proteobacteria bacterium]|nr:hypothetical protein [Pseudomonadota bacterium]
MSGIAGFIALDGSPAQREWVPAVADALARYGPDGVNHWCAGPAALLHGQLATTPEALAERQPVTDDAAQLVLCLDGRLDNRTELFAWLKSRETLPEPVSDAALLLALFKCEGDECVRLLVGDFAFAVWDARKRRLFCARSVLGWRPFHWHCDARTFAFGTDAGVLLAIPTIRRRVNEPLIGEILSQRFTHPTETLWRDVFRLRAGWALAVEGGPPRAWRWHAGPFPDQERCSDQAYAEQFRELFDQSLLACARSDGLVAAQLSGGLDSSSVVCRGAELYSGGALAHPFRPISAVFPGELHDESSWIRSVEEHLGVPAEKVTAADYDWDQAEAWTAQTLHLPLRPNTTGTLMAVCDRLQTQGIRVLLTGEGGDDWLAGSHAHWPDLLRRGRWRQLLGEGMALNPGRPRWRALLSTGYRSLGPWLMPSHRRAITYPYHQLGPLSECIRPEWADRIGLRDRLPPPDPMAGLNGLAQFQRAARYDFARTYVNWENVLAFAASQRIELRHPFHDRRLTEFVMGLPGDQLRRNGERKHILREAMRGTLPELVRTRQNKAMFASPTVRAIEARLKHRPLADLICVREGWLDGAALAQALGDYQGWLTNGPSRANLPETNLNPVWMAVSLDAWLRCAAGGS